MKQWETYEIFLLKYLHCFYGIGVELQRFAAINFEKFLYAESSVSMNHFNIWNILSIWGFKLIDSFVQLFSRYLLHFEYNKNIPNDTNLYRRECKVNLNVKPEFAKLQNCIWVWNENCDIKNMHVLKSGKFRIVVNEIQQTPITFLQNEQSTAAYSGKERRKGRKEAFFVLLRRNVVTWMEIYYGINGRFSTKGIATFSRTSQIARHCQVTV